MQMKVFGDLFTAVPEEIAKEYGLKHTTDKNGMGLAIAAHPMPLFNQWLGLGVLQPATPSAIAEVSDWMRQHAASGWGIRASPVAALTELPGWMADNGLSVSEESSATYWRDAAPVENAPECPFDIREIQADKQDDWLAVLGGAGRSVIAGLIGTLPDRPRWRSYIAYDGATPVASALTFFDGELAYFGGASTAMGHQNRGAQSALLARRIDDARALGAKMLVVQTTRTGKGEVLGTSDRNIIKAGFQLSHLSPRYGAA
jgi:hypothetical protein